jgi:hypothetical protein
MRTTEPMMEPTPYDDFSPGPHRDRLRRDWLEYRAQWREFEIRMAERRGRRQAIAEMIKRQEELAARRRCWLF